MPRRSPKEVKQRHKKAADRQIQWHGSWRDAYRYYLPQRDILDQPSPGQPKGELVFDSTGMSSAQTFANRMQSLLFPPFHDFVKLEPGPNIPPQSRDQLAKVLQQISKEFHAAIWHSNFDLAIGELLIDYTVGTASMLINEGPDDDPLQFDAVPIPSVALEAGPRGSVGGIYREHKLQVDLVKPTWRDIEKLPEAWETKLKDDPTQEVNVLEATYADHDLGIWYYDLFAVTGGSSGDAGLTFLLDKPRVYESYSPWATPRWVKAANEIYGRGPALFALPDVRTANKTIELVLKNASMAISGVYTGVDDGVFNPDTAAFVPGAIIPVARNDGPFGPSLKELPRAGSFDVAQLIIEDMRANIRRILYDRGLPEATGPVRSPTEIVERLRELQVDIGGAFGRVMKELVAPIVLRSLQILKKKGTIDFPDVISGNTIKITIISPLARLQSLDDIQAVLQWFEIAGVLGMELFALSAQVEKMPAWFGRKLGVDEELLRDEGSSEALMERVAQIIAQQTVAEQQPPTGAGAQTAGGAPPVASVGGVQ